tara:strand:+ start:108478 stop:110472 length:1995 start_codon:yes stop_codon:yes gene_type:complete
MTMARRGLTRVTSEVIKDGGVASEDIQESAVGLRELNVLGKDTATPNQVVGVDANNNLVLLTASGTGGNVPVGVNVNDIIKWDGAQWVAVSDSSVQMPTNVADGQVLAWDATNSAWVAVDQFPAATDGQVLSYDAASGTWVAVDMPTGTGGQAVPVFGALPQDGDFDAPRIAGGKTPAVQGLLSTSRIVDAFDSLNEIVGLLLPDAPALLSTKTLTFGNTNGLKYANNYIDNTGSGPAAGDDIPSRTTSVPQTSIISGFGSGNSGVLDAVINGVVDGSVTLDGTDNSGTDASLTITANNDYPATTPGFFQDLSARMRGVNMSVGLNQAKLLHSETGETNTAHVLYDTVAPDTTATIDSYTVTNSVLTQSSGIPHYVNGTTITLDGTGTNLATNAYKSSGVFVISATNGTGSNVSINPGSNGLPAIFDKDLASASFTGAVFTIGGNIHSTSKLGLVSHNPDKTSSKANVAETLLVMSGNPTPTSSGPVIEMQIPVSASLGSIPSGAATDGYRVNGSDFSAWDSSASTAPDEASVVGGILKHDNTDYTSGYLPAGPDYSNKNSTQYLTFEFRRTAVSLFDIQITGSYSGIEVQLPGVAGWWDMYQLYSGSGVPNPGCALGSIATGSTGTFTCTFGTQSSTNATDNKVYVRIKLEAGDAVSGIQIRS